MLLDRRMGFLEIKRIVLQRIRLKQWPPGTIIPGEAELAHEFGVARATVNRALQALALEGHIDRKRRAGTRVRPAPLRHARLEIPQLRHEIESAGHVYAYRLVSRSEITAPDWLSERLKLVPEAPVLALECLHFADDRPFQFEERWVNLAIAGDILKADLGAISPSEWLIDAMPFTEAEFCFSAKLASLPVMEHLQIVQPAAVFVSERMTWLGADPITFARMTFQPGYALMTRI
jgi:GntR family transcriptional regulator, histidine utilization repressor